MCRGWTLWYRANKHNGTLPKQYRDATLDEILDDMDLGVHAVIPDFQDLRSDDDDIDRVLGIYRMWFMPYHATPCGVDRVVERHGDRTEITYRTPCGDLHAVVVYDESMRKAGITITHIAEHVIKGPADLKALAWLFDHVEVLGNDTGYRTFADRVGDRGVAVGYATLAGSPMHWIMRDLIRMDDFFLLSFDYPDELAQLAQSLGRFYDRMMAVLCDSSAQVILLGANYDSSVTNPPFFAEHIAPWLKKYSDRLAAKGKFLLTHTDGENDGLLQQYVDAGVAVADSVCPRPMTRLGIADYRRAFEGKVAIWGGVPSVALVNDSMSQAKFDAYMENFFADIGSGDRLIVSVADTLPAGAVFERIKQIAELARQFGPVPEKSKRSAPRMSQIERRQERKR